MFYAKSISASLLFCPVSTVGKTSFLIYEATGRKEILCASPWDCLCQQQKTPSYGKSNVGRTESILRMLSCSGGTSLADTHRQYWHKMLLMHAKSFCAGVASCMTYVTGAAVVPVQYALQESCQYWDLCFQLRTWGQAHTTWRQSIDMWACFRSETDWLAVLPYSKTVRYLTLSHWNTFLPIQVMRSSPT